MHPPLDVSGISFSYGRAQIVHEWAETFHSGEVVALTGPSGRGKSTVLYILGLMLRPAAGRISVAGADANLESDGDRSRLRASVYGFVFQDAALDPTRTVLDNVTESALYRGESRKAASVRAMDLLDQMGVELRADHKPGQISGGQAQRIALCRALLGNPRILLADEPTGNLDPSSTAVVVEALRGQASQGSAVIVATHDPALVSNCDRVVQL
jgi:ABC-type lipoprotein export system ATPase subunit